MLAFLFITQDILFIWDIIGSPKANNRFQIIPVGNTVLCSIQFSHKCHKFSKFFKPLRCSDQSLFYLDLRVLMMCYYREWHFCFHLSAGGASSRIQLSKVPPNQRSSFKDFCLRDINGSWGLSFEYWRVVLTC